MTQTPEIPNIPEVPQSPEKTSEIPEAIEQGQPMVQQQPQAMPRATATSSVATSPANAPQTITIPADPAQLTTLAKGNPVNAITWFANFWLRIIKKALSLGSSIMTSQSINIPTPEGQGNTGDASATSNTSNLGNTGNAGEINNPGNTS